MALVLIVLGSSLEAAHENARERLVEVRAGARVLARAALLIETPEQGLMLRLGDLSGPLPQGVDWPPPVRLSNELYLPLERLDAARFRLDEAQGVLVFEDPARAGGAALVRPLPAYRYRLEPAEGGAVGDLLWLGAAPLPLPPAALEPAAGPPPGAAPRPRLPQAFKGSAGEPLPGAVRRREPLEPPLVESQEWREWLVSVVLNGAVVSEGALMIRAPDGAWAARVLDLRAWRLRLDDDRILSFNGEPFYPLDALPGLEQSFDEPTLTLTLTVPAGQFEASRAEGGRLSTIAPQAGRGGFVDYDLLALAGDGARERLDALLELGLFDKMGTLVSDFRAGDLTEDGREVVRLDTTYTKDFPSRRATLRLGDTLSAGGALGGATRLGGIQFSSNFATDPSFISFPLPTIGGLADQPSVAEVFLDNSRRLSTDLQAGPFEIDNLPVVTGAGEVQLKVTDLLGRETLITQSFYVSPRLLLEGLSEFSYELGFERESFNEESFDYGAPLVVGTHRYGLTDWLTGEGHIEASPDVQASGLGGSLLLNTWGLLSGGLIGSHDDDAGEGFSGFLDYEYRANRFSVGLRSRYSAPDFREIGEDDEPDRRVDQVNVGFGLHPYGRIGAFLVNTEARDGRDQRSVAASYSLSLGFGSLLINGVQTLAPDHDFALTASVFIPLSPVNSVSASAGTNDGEPRGRLEYRRSHGSSDLGPSYHVAAEAGGGERELDGSVRYDASLASGQLDLERRDGDSNLRANLEGSLAVIDGHARLSRRLGPAFGLVALPGYPDITVYLENREVGRTDDAGYLLLPRLNPYEENRVRIRPEDLPLSAEIDGDEQIAVPYGQSGVSVGFEVHEHRTALATLLDRAGKPLPAGLELESADGATTAQVASDGLAYVSGGPGEGQVELRSRPGQPARRCVLPPLPKEPMAALGEIRCD